MTKNIKGKECKIKQGKVTKINIPIPMLTVDHKLFMSNISTGVKQILSEGRKISENLTFEEIEDGKRIIIPMKGEKPNREKDYSVVVYHVPFETDESSIITSFDMRKANHKSVDHDKIIRKLINSVSISMPEAEIILCTTEEFGKNYEHKNLKKIYPKADPAKPMYNRVKTYNTLIQQDLIGKNTIFMDSDIMILRNPWEDLSKINFDVGVTYRFDPGLVPINEGVIYCRGNSLRVKEFFSRYIQTYEKVKTNGLIYKIVQTDLEKWRGGQLSLNGTCSAGRMVNHKDSTDSVAFLPCEKYNRTIYDYNEVKRVYEDNLAFLVHAKGAIKHVRP